MSAVSRKLAVGDIDDLRAYERVRDQYRARMIELRNRRRVALGTMVSVAFESRETIKFQIQEMARAERISTDEGIQDELDAYNPLVPEPGQLRATLFIELTSDDSMREWLPRLVGIEQSVLLRLPDGQEVRAAVDPGHAAQLTREHVTTAVHYLGWEFAAQQVAAFGPGTLLVTDHAHYQEEAELSPSTVAELATDLGDN
jgi:hypothetical protein